MATPFDADIQRLKVELGRVNSELIALQQKKAELISPYKVGDIIEENENVRGHRRAQVTKIVSGWSDDNFRLMARVFTKKDDKLSIRVIEIWGLDQWHKVELPVSG